MRRGLGFLLSVGLVAGSLFVGLPQASATVPGLNGVIAFSPTFMVNGALELVDPATGEVSTIRIGSDNSPSGRPTWSPNGTRLAVASSNGVVMIDVDGTDRRLLPYCYQGPTWGPDPDWIACTGSTDDMGTSGIVVLKHDGSEAQMITEGGSPDWSPGGEWIAFVRASDQTTDIWKIRPDGSDLTQLTDLAVTHPGLFATGPLSWSPDSAELAFTLTDRHRPAIVRMSASGGALTNVTSRLGIGPVDGVAWSPDGQRMAAISQRDSRLIVFGLDGGPPKTIPTMARYPGPPSWQPASLTVRSSRSVVDAGSTLTLTMRLAWPGENNTIQLQSHRQGDTWRNVKTLTADSSGTVKAPVTIRANTWFRTKWSGDSGHTSATSVPTYVEARLVLTAGLKKSYDRKGRTYLYHAKREVVFLGHLNPPKPDDKVCFTTQYRANRGYKTFDVSCYRTFDKGRLHGIIWTFQKPTPLCRIRATWEPTAQRSKDLDNLADTTKWSYFKVTR